MVAEEPEYTLWGWILLSMFGITPKPDHVVYRCQICRQSLGSTRDPKVLARRTGQKKAEPMTPSPAPSSASPAAEGSHPEENTRT
jgi:hypothetical protein